MDIQVEGAPEEDKQITVEIEIHGENAIWMLPNLHISESLVKKARFSTSHGCHQSMPME